METTQNDKRFFFRSTQSLQKLKLISKKNQVVCIQT